MGWQDLKQLDRLNLENDLWHLLFNNTKAIICILEVDINHVFYINTFLIWCQLQQILWRKQISNKQRLQPLAVRWAKPWLPRQRLWAPQLRQNIPPVLSTQQVLWEVQPVFKFEWKSKHKFRRYGSGSCTKLSPAQKSKHTKCTNTKLILAQKYKHTESAQILCSSSPLQEFSPEFPSQYRWPLIKPQYSQFHKYLAAAAEGANKVSKAFNAVTERTKKR